MITYTMTKDELVRELRAECDWLDGLRPGIVIKYKKRLNPRTAKEGFTLLGKTAYTTPRNNRVHVAWVREKVGNYITILSVHFYEYTNQYGKKQYINPCYNGFGNNPRRIVVYTSHAMSRLLERAGMTIQDLLFYDNDETGYNIGYVGEYEYKGKKSTMFNLGDKGMFITEDCNWGVAAVTFVNYELLGPVQTAEIKKAIEKTKSYNEMRAKETIDFCKTVPRYARRTAII